MDRELNNKEVLVIWISFVAGSAVMMYYFGWMIGLYLSVWTFASMLGLVLTLNGHPGFTPMWLAALGMTLDAAGFWFVGDDGVPLFAIFGFMTYFGVTTSDAVRQRYSKKRILTMTVVGILFFGSLVLGPRYGVSGYEREYTEGVDLMIVGFELAVLLIVRRGLMRTIKIISGERKQHEELVEAKGWYVESFGMVSHNIKTPLAVLSSKFELAELKSRAFDDVRFSKEEMAQLKEKTKEINELLMQFLALQKEGTKLAGEKISLADLVDRIAQSTECPLKREGTPDARHLTEVELFALRQALDVLVDNAKKYAGHAPDLILDDRGVTVQDQGPGLPKEKAKTFAQQVVKSQSAGGSGIGLYFAARLLEKAGWQLQVVNFTGGLSIRVSPR